MVSGGAIGSVEPSTISTGMLIRFQAREIERLNERGCDQKCGPDTWIAEIVVLAGLQVVHLRTYEHLGLLMKIERKLQLRIADRIA